MYILITDRRQQISGNILSKLKHLLFTIQITRRYLLLESSTESFTRSQQYLLPIDILWLISY